MATPHRITYFTHFSFTCISPLFFFARTAWGAHHTHPEHPAVHATVLRKKISTSSSRGTNSIPAARENLVQSFTEGDGYWSSIDRKKYVDQIMNLTTELHDQKSEYTGSIGVGTNHDGKALFQANVVFDTGSTNLWVASKLCNSGVCKSGGRYEEFYDPQTSLTQEDYKGRKGDIDIMFGTGELRGPLNIDTYRVGPMEVKGQPFAMIRDMTGDVFSSFPFEGILGLAFKSLAFGGITPFFERVIDQKVLDNNEFAFYLNADTSQPSALLWGGVDKDLFEGPIVMFPVTQPHYWSMDLVEFRIGDKIFGGTRHPGSNLKKVIVDSGTTYFTAPRAIINGVLEHMQENPCKEVEKYEPMVYVLRGIEGDTFELVVTQETYMVGVAGNENVCRPAFMPLDVNPKYGPALILGEVFMRHFFTVFSRGSGAENEARIGIAQAKIGAPVKVSSNADKPMPSKREIQEVTQQFTSGHIIDGTHGTVPILAEQGSKQRKDSPQRHDASHRQHKSHLTSLKTPHGAHRYKGRLFAPFIQEGEEDRAVASGKEAGAVAVKDNEAEVRRVNYHVQRSTTHGGSHEQSKGLLRREPEHLIKVKDPSHDRPGVFSGVDEMIE
jgi:hypothetical protein